MKRAVVTAVFSFLALVAVAAPALAQSQGFACLTVKAIAADQAPPLAPSDTLEVLLNSYVAGASLEQLAAANLIITPNAGPGAGYTACAVLPIDLARQLWANSCSQIGRTNDGSSPVCQ